MSQGSHRIRIDMYPQKIPPHKYKRRHKALSCLHSFIMKNPAGITWQLPKDEIPFSQSNLERIPKEKKNRCKIYIKTSALLLVVFFFFEGLLLRIKELHHFRMTGSSDESIFYYDVHKWAAQQKILRSRLDGTDCTRISQHGVCVWNVEKFWARTSWRPPAPDFANFFSGFF